MNAVHTPAHSSPISPVDRQNAPESAPRLGALPASPREAALPRADASEPTELSVVAVRGYN